MVKFLKLLLRRLLAGTAVVVIFLAIAIGGLRLLMTQLPSYQNELQAWVTEALGLRLGFNTMDVRLSWRGPELTFHDAAVAAAGVEEAFLVASRAAVVIDPWAAISRRELRVARLTIDDTRLTLAREADGRLRLQGAPTGREARADLAQLLPPDIEIDVRDSRVAYVDAERGIHWELSDVSLSLSHGADTLQLEAIADPPAELGSRIEIAAQSDFTAGAGIGRGWRLFGDLRDVDLAELSAALPVFASMPQRGHGDVSLWLEWRDDALQRGMIEADLADIAWSPAASGVAPDYKHLAVSGEWVRDGDDWRLMLDNVELQRNGLAWPAGTDSVLELRRDGKRFAGLSLRSSFLRLEDLAPIVEALPQSSATRRWLELDPGGELRAVDIDLQRNRDSWDYTIAGNFERLSAEPTSRWPGFAGFSGVLRADSTSGRLDFATRDAELDWPQLFRSAFDIDELSGILVWRKGSEAIRLVSDDLLLRNPDGTARSNLELTLPLDGSSPRLDIETDVGPFEAVAVKRYLPVHKMPPVVVSWLDRAIQGGDVAGAELSFAGPLAAFPFDAGEGYFRVTADVKDGVLEFVDGWPRAEDLDCAIEFSNASFSAHGSGRVLGNEGADMRVGIVDMRNAVLTVRGDTTGPLSDVLAFLQRSPLIARHLGPGYERLHAPAGTARVGLDLSLPLRNLPAYELGATLAMTGGELAIDGFGPHWTEIEGSLTLADGTVTGKGIEGILLDGPVTARVSAAGVEGYRARLDIEGEVTADAVAKAFDLPLADLLAGQTRWEGSMLIPAQPDDAEVDALPLQLDIASNLSGVALKFPAPFAKAPADATSLELEVVIPDSTRLDVRGHLGATRRFRLSFADGGDGDRRFRRGALRFGGSQPQPRSATGLTIDGTLAALHFDDWVAVARGARSEAVQGSSAETSFGDVLTEADLDIADFTVFGQQLGQSRLNVRRATDEWLIGVDSTAVAGTIVVPRNLDGRPPIVADMQRLYLSAMEGGAAVGEIDPRTLPGLSLTADEVAFGPRRLGRLRADIQADPAGLKLTSFESSSGSFKITGSGGWYDGPQGSTTRLAFSLGSTDVAASLAQLALDPIAEGKMAQITADVQWPGPPSADWMQHLGGNLALSLKTGSLLDLDPGAGRVVGLMSISALPRRLALDFRDVFNKGLVFDEIAGDFSIIDGNAYTDNLKVTGPTAEIGVAGRIGLRDRDYRQQAIVAAEPGKMLPTVGGLLGGPGVGAALLIFTKIFKEPLKGIGRASYCVTGTWEQPKVERLTPQQLEQGQLCAELPGDGMPSGPQGANPAADSAAGR